MFNNICSNNIVKNKKPKIEITKIIKISGEILGEKFSYYLNQLTKKAPGHLMDFYEYVDISIDSINNLEASQKEILYLEGMENFF
jgi:hypothetical protein